MTIDVYSDVACPWCYIGKRRLAAALRVRPGLTPDVRWRPFQLQPHLPQGGVPWEEFAIQKFGGWERARGMFAGVARAGKADGISFDFEGIAAAVNTADAQRLILYAKTEGLEWEMAEALFQAYFSDGRHVGAPHVLRAIAAEVGLDGVAAAAYLQSDAGRVEVVQSQQEATRRGIQGVPFYVFDGQFGLSGAQPVETFLQALDRMADRAA